MEYVDAVQACCSGRGGGGGASTAAKVCAVHRTRKGVTLVACVTKDLRLLCWDAESERTLIALHLPTLDKNAFKASSVFKGLRFYDREDSDAGSEIVVLTESDLCFVHDKRLSPSPSLESAETNVRLRLISNKKMGTSKALAALAVVRLPSVEEDGCFSVGKDHVLVCR